MNLRLWRDRIRTSVLMLSVTLVIPHAATAIDSPSTSSYGGQQARAVKALSDRETADLLAGRGMGYALAAELNRYPGPLHVIELADHLGLSDEQRRRTEEIFRAMQAKARALGAEIVAAERALDEKFASGTIDQASLDAETAALGILYGRVRAAHLSAHLGMKALLTPHQIAAYDRLRGYGATQPASPPSHSHSGQH